MKLMKVTNFSDPIKVFNEYAYKIVPRAPFITSYGVEIQRVELQICEDINGSQIAKDTVVAFFFAKLHKGEEEKPLFNIDDRILAEVNLKTRPKENGDVMQRVIIWKYLDLDAEPADK